MPEDLDCDGVIVALTDGVGVRLGRRARSSFYRLLGRLPDVHRFREMSVPLQQQTVDILALAIVYSEIVSPLESGRSFMKLTKAAGATHVRIGGDKLTPHFASSARSCVSAFHNMLQAAEIPAHLLSFPSLKVFVDNVVVTAIERTDESLDQ